MNAEASDPKSRAVEPSKQAQQQSEQSGRDQELLNSEKRRPLYEDVEALVNPGFLAHSFSIRGVSYSLRTLTPGDVIVLRHRVPKNASDRVWKEWVLATCIWMVDGQVLFEHPEAVLTVRKSLRTLRPSGLDILWGILQGLLNRVSASIPKIEPYCYEYYSRAIWKFCGRQTPVQDNFIGIPGVSRLGTNLVQRLWISYNLAEDDRLSDQQRWTEAKLVASAQSPKGVKQLNQSDETRWNQELARRRRLQDRLYYNEIGWREDHKKLVFEPHSADELVEQMRRWTSGEKDLHDVIVDAWKDRVRDGISQTEQKQQQLAAERAELREKAEDAGAPIVGYTIDQIQGLVKNKPRTVIERTPNTVLYDKYLREEVRSVGEVPDLPLQKTLEEELSDRQPVFNVVDAIPSHLRDKFRADLDANDFDKDE